MPPFEFVTSHMQFQFKPLVLLRVNAPQIDVSWMGHNPPAVPIEWDIAAAAAAAAAADGEECVVEFAAAAVKKLAGHKVKRRSLNTSA